METEKGRSRKQRREGGGLTSFDPLESGDRAQEITRRVPLSTKGFLRIE